MTPPPAIPGPGLVALLNKSPGTPPLTRPHTAAPFRTPTAGPADADRAVPRRATGKDTGGIPHPGSAKAAECR